MSKYPFNVGLLKPNQTHLSSLRRVSSLDVFEGGTKNFHPDGLYSALTFGPVGDERRLKRFGYINLKIEVFHPVMFRALGELKSLYEGIILSKAYAVWDEEMKDFVKSNRIDGHTGYQFFMTHWKNLNIPKGSTGIREVNTDLYYKFKDTGTYDSLIVLPAGLRDLEIGDDGRVATDEINNYYQKIIAIVNPITEAAVKNNPEILDLPRATLQRTLNELYAHLESMLDGKKKIMLGKWASRTVFNGTRNVITAETNKIVDLFSEGNPTINDTTVGLYQGLKGILPISIFHLREKYLSKVFTGPNSPANLINKKTLKSETVKIKPATYDLWMTDEGLERVISSFVNESLRHKTLEIENRYVALIYMGDDHRFKIFFDIDELPQGFDKTKVSPITFCELLYLSIYKDFNKYPLFVTRYPITGYGSIYPSFGYLKPTTTTIEAYELDDDWSNTVYTAFQFPVRGSTFVNSMSPSPSHEPALGADHDGDTCSANFAYFDESIEEVRKLIKSAQYYRSTSGGVAFPVVDDILQRVIHGMTS